VTRPATRYDVKRGLRQCDAPRNTDWALVDVPAQRFIAIDGRGDPNTSADYTSAVEALYTALPAGGVTHRRRGQAPT
jgi:hypothetical protein